LAFREANLVEAIQSIISQFVKAGQGHGSRMGLFVAQAYEQEARQRAELVVGNLRLVRRSWSPKQLIDGQQDFRTTVLDLFKANLSTAAELAEKMGGMLAKRQQGQQGEVSAFLSQTDRGSKATVAVVDAVIAEIVAAAGNDIAARAPIERPSYVFQTFQGPVASVANDGASVAQVSQTVNAATPMEIAEAVAALIRALPAKMPTTEAIKAKDELVVAEKELRIGRVPLTSLARALGLFREAEDIAIRAPEAANHIAALGRMLGFG
jgi:hypothetical protein